MRIEGNSPLMGPGYAGAASRPAAGDAFALAETADAPRAGPVAPTQGPTGIEALLALQAAEEPLLARRKAVRRGRSLLDTLDDMKADLLAGRLSEGRLNALAAVMGQAREATEPGLDATLDAIELRVAVELAKRGR